jgi:FMN-dependent NADH-azoreductase
VTILHIDSSITGQGSVSRQISQAVVDTLLARQPGAQVIRRDLVSDPLPHLTLAGAGDRSALDEFLAADTVVIGAPMYNFSVPSQLKAWIDRIAVAGETFRYTAAGAEGLAGDKRVIIAVARGGFYGADTPVAAMEHVETYLRAVFNFFGIEPEFVSADGVNIGPEQKEAALAQAQREAWQLAA